MKSKRAKLGLLIYFVLYQSEYFWGRYLDSVDMLLMLIYMVLGAILGFFWLFDSLKNLKERFRSGTRKAILQLGFLTALSLPLIFPSGLINFERFRSPIEWIAFREGVANCTVRYIFRADNHFESRQICFTTDHDEGTFSQSGDTLFLEYKGRTQLSSEMFIVDLNDKKNPIGRLFRGKEEVGGFRFFKATKEE